jgi:hypothetical protein
VRSFRPAGFSGTQGRMLPVFCACADLLKLYRVRQVGHHDPCLRCGAQFIGLAFKGEAGFAKHCNETLNSRNRKHRLY